MKEWKAQDDEMIEMIVDTYPSICWACNNSRRAGFQPDTLPVKTSSMELSGYVGCVAPFKHYKTFDKNAKRIEAEEKYNGIVDLHAKPFMFPSNQYTQRLLITRCTSFCPYLND